MNGNGTEPQEGNVIELGSVQADMRKCGTLFCGIRQGNYCCMYCYKKDTCYNVCYNSPERCDQMYLTDERYSKRRFCNIRKKKRAEEKEAI